MILEAAATSLMTSFRNTRFAGITKNHCKSTHYEKKIISISSNWYSYVIITTIWFKWVARFKSFSYKQKQVLSFHLWKYHKAKKKQMKLLFNRPSKLTKKRPPFYKYTPCTVTNMKQNYAVGKQIKKKQMRAKYSSIIFPISRLSPRLGILSLFPPKFTPFLPCSSLYYHYLQIIVEFF